MKTILLLIDGAVGVFIWLVLLLVMGIAGYMKYAGDLKWTDFGLVVLSMFAFLFIATAFYRLFTYPLRTEAVRENLLQALRDGLITREAFEEAMKLWSGGYVAHILFGIKPQ